MWQVPGTIPIASLPTGTSTVAGVFSSAGASALSGVGRATASSVLAASGLGAFSGALRVTTAAVLNASGVGNLSGKTGTVIAGVLSSAGVGNLAGVATAITPASLSAAGVGSMVTTSYAFYGDNETAKVYQELRTAFVDMENRLLTRLDADREEEVGEEDRVAGPPNRTRH